MVAQAGEIELINLFPVPLLMTQVENSDTLNGRLVAETLERRGRESGVERSNRYGWHSEADFFQRKEPAHAELAKRIRAFVEKATRQTMPKLPAELAVACEGWVNINPSHAFNAPHDHPGSFWSGTYYAQVPLPEREEDKMSGAIEFIDPRGSLGTSARIETPFTRGKFTLRPAAGTLLLWPGYLRHWVYPNMSTKERFTVSFNAWYNRSKS
ncbi:TIGR02466 family protein [Sphingomonas sp. HDW15A]|uniref:TIGR02466 family protein n=1 Tax=Sphingomonas sp. HDW15A TaxID=2714942 RepID=UPI001F114FA1|nr:TIGR02466 family protein [Sphingomonas sp. HDW15A]